MDIDKMIKLLQAFSDSNLSSFKYEEGNITIKLERQENGNIESKTSNGGIQVIDEGYLKGETDRETVEKVVIEAEEVDNNNNNVKSQPSQDFVNTQEKEVSSNTESANNNEDNKTSTEVVDKESSGNFEVKAPTVGTFYASSSPEGEPFVNVGDVVEKGQVICIVEAMKVMNEIESPVNGLVKDILVENEGLVEFGQVMLVLEPHN